MIALKYVRGFAAVVAVSCVLTVESCGGGSTNPANVSSDAAVDAIAPDDAGGATCSPDVSSDPNNCGRCAHNCLGGSCAHGICAPFPLTADEDSPSAIAIDDTYVYFDTLGPLSGGAIRRVPKAGGAAETLYIESGLSTWAMQLTANDIVFVATREFDPNDYIYSMPKGSVIGDAGALKIVTKFASTTFGEDLLATDDSRAYLTDELVATDGGTREIRSVPLDGGTLAAVAAHSLPPGASISNVGVSIIDTDPTRIFYSDGFDPSSIFAAPKPGVADGGAGELVYAQTTGPSWGLRVSGTTLFVVDGTTLKSLDLSAPDPSSTVRLLAVGLPLGGISSRVEADDNDVYFAGNFLYRCPRSGCGANPTVLADVSDAHIAIDDAAVYWTSRDGGVVMKMAK